VIEQAAKGAVVHQLAQQSSIREVNLQDNDIDQYD
jgi:hypothetical protein